MTKQIHTENYAKYSTSQPTHIPWNSSPCPMVTNVLRPQKDLQYWKESGNKTIMRRISSLLADILEHPFTGIGNQSPSSIICKGNGHAE